MRKNRDTLCPCTLEQKLKEGKKKGRQAMDLNYLSACLSIFRSLRQGFPLVILELPL